MMTIYKMFVASCTLFSFGYADASASHSIQGKSIQKTSTHRPQKRRMTSDMRNFKNNLNWAMQGSAPHQNEVGYLYLKGKGVKKNIPEAMKWFEKSAGNGDCEAQTNLAYAYYLGKGVKENLSKAGYWYFKAAEQGHFLAQTALGFMYQDRCLVSENPQQEALKWFQKAASQGHDLAQYELANLYLQGTSIPQNLEAAVEMYGKASNQGFSLAKFALGSIYEKGEVIENDDHKAEFFYASFLKHVKQNSLKQYDVEEIQHKKDHATSFLQARAQKPDQMKED